MINLTAGCVHDYDRMCDDCVLDAFHDPRYLQMVTTKGEDQSTKEDHGKRRWRLLPWGPIEDVVRVLEYGATKYAAESWRRTPNGSARYWEAAMRHLIAWRQGEVYDTESGLPHIAHALCCLVFVHELTKTHPPCAQGGDK